MWKKSVIAAAILAVGLLGGWWLRGEAAVDACLDMGGTWGPPGLCYGATRYRFD